MQFTLLIYTFVSTYLIISTSHVSLEINEIRKDKEHEAGISYIGLSKFRRE